MSEAPSTAGKISKILVATMLLMLILSFTLWGVGDVFRTGLGMGSAAEVGGEKVPMDEYDRAISVSARRLEMQLGQPVNEEALKHYQIPQQTMAVIINQTLMRQEGERLGIRLPNEPVAKAIRADERFLNKQGTFDRPQFDRMLSMYGYTEKSYVESVRADFERGLLMAGFTARAPILQEQISALFRHREEKRTASVLSITPEQVKDVKEPADKDLQDYYTKNKDSFATLEVRNVSYLAFSVADIAHEMDLSEEVLKTEYKFREDEFAPKQKRTLQQVIVQDEAKAKELAGLLEKNSTLKDAAKKAGVADDFSEIGTFTPDDLIASGIIPNEAVAQAFQIEKGKATAPFKSPLGWHILAVAGIDKGTATSFEDAKPRLKEILLKEKGGDLLYELSTRVEDKLAGGASLEEVAADMKLKLHTVTGLTPDTKHKGDEPLPEFGEFVVKVFGAEQGKVSDLVANEDNTSYYLLRVDGTTPSRVKALAEVHDEVVAAWKKEQRKAQLATLAAEIAAKLQKGGTTLEQEAAALGLKLSSQGPIRRDYKETDKMTPAMMEDLFTLSVGKTGTAHVQGERYCIIRTDKILPAEEKDRAMAEAAIAGELKEAAGNDVQEQMIIHLRTTHPVKQYVGQ